MAPAMRTAKTLFLALQVVLVTACATTAPPPATSIAAPRPDVAVTRPCNPGDTLLNATLWMETSAEYQASARQTYGVAHRLLDTALADPSWSAVGQTAAAASMPPAIVLDLDETALDNMGFESRAIEAGTTYTPQLWSQWVSESAAGTTPGAAEFLAYAKSRGVTPFYVTNRKAEEEAATRANLEKLGYPLGTTEDTLLVVGERPEWTSDKTSRREFVASTHRVLMLFGDDLNDFAAAAGKSRAERDSIVRQHQDDWGIRWFILPNPVYGSWEKATMSDATGPTDCEKKIDRLRR
jgi:acid phosphatase